MFHICFSQPRVLACAEHMISGDFRISALNSRTAQPGDGLIEQHADSGSRVKPGEYENAMSIWFLVDFTEENGPTRVVPGSHRNGKLTKDVLDDTWAEHPDEVHLTGKAETVYVFNAHIWHGGTKNNSGENRPAAFVLFGRRDIPQYIDQRKYIRPDTYNRLSDAGRYILDVVSRPFERCETDIVVEDDSVIDIEGIAVRCIAAPGHADGMMIFEVTLNGAILWFTGDLIEVGPESRSLQLGWLGGPDFDRGIYLKNAEAVK